MCKHSQVLIFNSAQSFHLHSGVVDFLGGCYFTPWWPEVKRTWSWVIGLICIQLVNYCHYLHKLHPSMLISFKVWISGFTKYSLYTENIYFNKLYVIKW